MTFSRQYNKCGTTQQGVKLMPSRQRLILQEGGCCQTLLRAELEGKLEGRQTLALSKGERVSHSQYLVLPIPTPSQGSRA
jgi:hypothetical protein